MGVITRIVEARQRDLGGLSVGRILPAGRLRTVGPFIFFDHLGPVELPPGRGVDVPPHPHIGLATVTYLFQGELLHRDSLGSVQLIRPGDVNWMVAGRGIVHSERSPADGRAAPAALHGVQSWVALPPAREEDAPAFAHHPADSLPLVESDGATLVLIAGDALGLRSPVAVASPTVYADLRLRPAGSITLPPEHEERAVFPLGPGLLVNGETAPPGALAILEPGATVTLSAAGGARGLVLGGAPLAGERHIWWNFVSTRPERIEQARSDWQQDRFDPVPGEAERVALPGS